MRRPPSPAFAGRAQGILILLLGLCFVLIAQQLNHDVYRYGLIALMVLTIVQIGLGNTDPAAGPLHTLRNLVITFLIVGGIVFLSVQLGPTLIGFGR
jgi:hypothetical protein